MKADTEKAAAEAIDNRKYPEVLIAGIGNPYRSDDGLGPKIADEVAGITGIKNIGPISEPLDLLGRFDNAELAILVDAMKSSLPAGTIRIFDLNLPEVKTNVTSTHGIGLERTVALARVLARAPAKIIVVGIEGKSFEDGDQLSQPVADVLDDAVRIINQIVLSEWNGSYEAQQ